MASPQAAEALALLLADGTPADLTKLPYVAVGLRWGSVVMQLQPQVCAEALTQRARELRSLQKQEECIRCHEAAAELRDSGAPLDAGPVTRLPMDLLRLLCPDGPADLRPPMPWLTAAAGRDGMAPAIDRRRCAAALLSRAEELKQGPSQVDDARREDLVGRCEELAAEIGGGAARAVAAFNAVGDAVAASQRGTQAALATSASAETIAIAAAAAAQEECAELRQQLSRLAAEMEARLSAVEAELRTARKEAADAKKEAADAAERCAHKGADAAVKQVDLHPAARPPIVSAGFRHAAVLLPSGGFREWGEVVAASPPTGGVTAVHVGHGFTVGIVAGTLKVWGQGDCADRVRRDVQRLKEEEVVCCSANGTSLAALTASCDLFLCGWKRDKIAVPHDLAGRIFAVAVGGSFVIALMADGAVYCLEKYKEPHAVDLGGRTAVAISAEDHYAVVLDDGSVLCGGDNRQGQCNVPTDLRDAVSCSCGYYFTVALRRDGSLSWWGDVPPHQKIDEAGSVAAVYAYSKYAVAVTTDGRLVADGDQCHSEFGLYDTPGVAAGPR